MTDQAIPFVLALGVAFSASLVWRVLGVLLAARIDPNGLLLRWFGCVAYAMLAALIAGYFVLPGGALGATPVATRLASVAAAFVAYYLARRNTALGVAAGLAAFLVIEAATGRIAL